MRNCSTAIALLAAVVLVICTRVSGAAPAYRFDFEKGSPEPFNITGAKITDSPGSVISGDRSLLADFSKSSGWDEYLMTNDKFVLEPDTTYHVSYKYRILNPGTKETKFYCCMKSRSGGEQYGEFWQWNREQGAEGTIHRLFKTGKKTDWFLLIGVRNAGSILIDDVEITKCDRNVPGYGLPIKSGKTSLLETKTLLDDVRKYEKLDQTLGDMLIVWCNEGAGAKITDRKDEFAKLLNPDFVDWNLCGPLAKDYGVRSSTGGPEYQEFYKFEGPSIYDQRYERFGDNGFAVSIDNTFIQDETWGEGGYFTCHNGDGWHVWFTQELINSTKNHFAVCQDNISCAPFYKGHGCFCKPCAIKFRSWLKSRYSASELSQFGIKDIESFNYADRVYRYGLVGYWALDDPVTREYVKFQFCSQLAAWADVVKAVKMEGKNRGIPTPVYGNQIGGFGMWPFAVAIGEFCDIIQLEEVIGVKDKIPNWSLSYKMGRAGGQESKPVWVRGAVHDERVSNAPQLSPLFWQTHFAEALANGGVRDISFGINAPWTGNPETLDYIDSPQVQQVWKDYAALCENNRAVFTHRKSMAKVALIYSLPTTMFRRYYPLDIDDNGYFSPFDKTAKWLDSKQVSYDCVIFGHPEAFPTAMAQLKNYDVVILPSADAISDIQATFLKSFVSRGGTIIKLGEIGTRDENLNLRKEGSILAGVRMIDFSSEIDKAEEILRKASPVSLEGPDSVTANVWLSANGASLDLHLVNYGADLVKGKWNEMKPFKAVLTVPQGFTFDTARLIQYSKEPQELAYTLENGRVSVTVPAFGSYAVISFADKAKLAAANSDAELRRLQDKMNVKSLAATKSLY